MTFITVSDFWWMLEPFHRTILGWVFVNYSCFLKLCCNYVFQISLLSISKKETNVTFAREFFAFTNSGWALFLLRSYLLSITSLVFVIHSSQNTIRYGEQTELYLRPSRTSPMELYSENSQRPKEVWYKKNVTMKFLSIFLCCS